MSNNKYTENHERFKSIAQTTLAYISLSSFYATHLKISVKEYANYHNSLIEKGTNVETVHTETHEGYKCFIIKKEGKFIPNDKVIQACIKNTEKGNKAVKPPFCYCNIVLDKLEEAFKNRKKHQ